MLGNGNIRFNSKGKLNFDIRLNENGSPQDDMKRRESEDSKTSPVMKNGDIRRVRMDVLRGLYKGVVAFSEVPI